MEEVQPAALRASSEAVAVGEVQSSCTAAPCPSRQACGMPSFRRCRRFAPQLRRCSPSTPRVSSPVRLLFFAEMTVHGRTEPSSTICSTEGNESVREFLLADRTMHHKPGTGSLVAQEGDSDLAAR